MSTVKKIVLFIFAISLISCANGGGVPLVQFIPNHGGGGQQFAPPPPPMMVVQPQQPRYYQRGNNYGDVRSDGYNRRYGGAVQGVVNPRDPFRPNTMNYEEWSR